MAVEAAEAGRRAATTGVSETETMVTTEMAVAGSTVVAVKVVGEEAISRTTTPDRSSRKRFAEV